MFYNLKEYIRKYSDGPRLGMDTLGDSDAWLCLIEIEKNPILLKNKEISEALKKAVERTPQYGFFKWEESKSKLFSKLTKIDLFILKIRPKYVKFILYLKYHLDAWKAAVKIFNSKYKMFPAYAVAEECPENEELVRRLEKVASHMPKEEETVVIEANIENHATGKVASSVWGRELKFDEGSKIVSYNIIPGKILDVQDEDPIRPVGGFISNGAVPIEVGFRENQF